MATALKDDWTEEKCLHLIREFRARPILWDPKDPLFFNRCTLKPNAWRDISNVIKISPDKCKHKMVVLMSSFRREKAKILRSMNTDPSKSYKSSWFAFKEMAFLMDKDSERKRQLNSTDEEEDDESLEFLKDFIGTPSPMKRCRATERNKELAKQVAAAIREEEELTPLPAPGPSQTTDERDEEIKSFTSFIGNKMKKYSDVTKNAVQQAICDVIFKADQNYYEPNNSYEKYTIIDGNTDPLNRAIYDVQSGTVIKVQNDSDTE